MAKVDPGDLIVTNTSENIEDVCKAVAWLGNEQIVTGGHATTGTAITKILPPVSRFEQGGGHAAKKRTVLAKLGEFFDRFFGLS